MSTTRDLLLGAAVATTWAMVLSLLATEVPVERRSATPNLVDRPLDVAGIAGPALGGAIAAMTGPAGPFVVGGMVFLAGTFVAGVAVRRRAMDPGVPESPSLR